MAYREFVSLIHKSTKRDYLARVTQRDKAPSDDNSVIGRINHIEPTATSPIFQAKSGIRSRWLSIRPAT